MTVNLIHCVLVLYQIHLREPVWKLKTCVILHHDSEFDPLCFSFVPNTSQGICLEVSFLL